MFLKFKKEEEIYKPVIVFHYYSKVKAVKFVHQYMLAYCHGNKQVVFSSTAPVIHHFPLSLCIDETDMRMIFCCYKYKSHAACHLDILNLKLIEYNCHIHIASETNIS